MSVGLQRLRDEPDLLKRAASDKGEDPAVVDTAISLDERRRELVAEGNALKAESNDASRRIGEAVRAGADTNGPDDAVLKSRTGAVAARITAINAKLDWIQEGL